MILKLPLFGLGFKMAKSFADMKKSQTLERSDGFGSSINNAFDPNLYIKRIIYWMKNRRLNPQDVREIGREI